ncbi:leukocyte surface antigen CD53-like [Poeciliopsis prolifica]|uniref:leukocyte surface antigen CD53-like n=1 Tax=Poeciliopsis prolifica TaxID=188132 RepID=UPI00072D64B9|nr:leukocyte surface antigen CD53-like [Poeciliopsis prolifica]
MAQGCLKCLKYTMCVANFLCFMCGVAVLSFGVYLMVKLNFAALTPTLDRLNIPSMLLISGIIITCVSFLGFLGALKENRCLLMTFFLVLFILMLVELTAACLMLIYEKEIGDIVTKDLKNGLEKARQNDTKISDWDLVQETFKCCGVSNVSDWGNKIPMSCRTEAPVDSRNNTLKPEIKYKEGCLMKLKDWFEENFLTTGIAVIILCIIEVLGMCFAMTLFCHISRSGLGYKL